MRLKGQVAIVTGAAQGIGTSYARALAEAGAAVVVADILDGAEAAGAITAAGGQAIAVRADVSSAASVATLAEETLRRFGRIDILVNNAAVFGTLTNKPFFEIDGAEWDKVMAVNVRGSFECAKAVFPTMRQQKYGKIINIASGTVFKGTPHLLHYVSSKGAVVAMTRCLARELGPYNICVNALAPGLTLSENVVTNPTWTQEMIAANKATRALKREQKPDDLLGALLFLASSDSDFMTGQTVVVDGGSVVH